ncbi:armadillo-type protein [Mycena vulgaris]|nr:armadillo-type protein [Mycena vulgaris]
MPPIQRTESLHSWWSDSNPPGATIPLHTLAKPLSKFLHRRQLAGIISQARGQPISREALEALMSYLEATEIPNFTKLSILTDLIVRAKTEAQAQTIGQKYTLGVLARLLHSSEIEIVDAACTLLGELARREYLNTAIVELNPFNHLISLATSVSKHSIYALSCISHWEGGARAIASANPWDLTARLLGSDDTDILQWIWRMLGNIARFESYMISPESSAPARLGSLLPRAVQPKALRALGSIPEASEPDQINDLDDTHGSAMIAESTHSTASLVKIIQHVDPTWDDILPVLSNALGVAAEIEHISESEPGATALAHSNVLHHLVEVLDFGNPSLILESACCILANIAQFVGLRGAVIRLLPYNRLLSLLRHPQTSVQHEALYALHHIYYYRGEFSITNVLAKLLDSPDLTVLAASFHMLKNLAYNDFLRRPIVEPGCCVPLVSFLNRRPNVPVTFYKEALEIFDRLSTSEFGACALANTDLLDRLEWLLDSRVPVLQELVCQILANLAWWPSPYKALVGHKVDFERSVHSLWASTRHSQDRKSLNETAAFAASCITLPTHQL